MSRPPTPRQLSVLRFVEQFIRRHRTPPAEREIAAHFAIHQSAVRKHLAALERKGLLQLARNGRSRGIKVNGEVESATLPLLATNGSQPAAGIALDARLAGEEAFILRAGSDAMSSAGINGGDLVVFRRSARVRNGELAAVLVEGRREIARWYEIAGRVILETQRSGEQPERRTLEREEEAHVEGYAVAILRTLGYSAIDELGRRKPEDAVDLFEVAGSQ